jgi:hypothetical protein
MYSAMSSIPSGGPPGGTHTQELWYSLRGIDARLESVLSTYKCLCDACCARSQPLISPNFVVFVLVFWTEKLFLRTSTIFYGRKCPCHTTFIILLIYLCTTGHLKFFSGLVISINSHFQQCSTISQRK